MKTYKKFTERERDRLARWKAQKLSNNECAKKLRRSASTIGRELKRNRWKGGVYVLIHHAQALADRREKKASHSKRTQKSCAQYIRYRAPANGLES